MAISRVLVVDDEPDLRRLTQFSLQAVGKWQVTAVASGEEAVAAALRERFDVVLLDVQMPGFDGLATLQALREQPSLAGLPVIFLTATALDHEQERLRALGALGVILKPFEPLGLASQVAALVAAGAPRAGP